MTEKYLHVVLAKNAEKALKSAYFYNGGWTRTTGLRVMSLAAESAYFHEQFRHLSLLSGLWFLKARQIAVA
jgi:hypothetical protein